MKGVIISIALFMLMKIAYNYFGVVGNVYWNVAFYVPMYFMVLMLLRYIRFYTEKANRLFLFISMLYFGALILVNLICIFDTDLYRVVIIELNKVGLPGVVLISGMGYIIYKLKKP